MLLLPWGTRRGGCGRVPPYPCPPRGLPSLRWVGGRVCRGLRALMRRDEGGLRRPAAAAGLLLQLQARPAPTAGHWCGRRCP